jgi:catechol 2,3-dioxygenase
MEVKELGHLVLYVHDIKRSAKFYGEVLGWKRISPEGLPIAAFSSGRTHHELLLIEVGSGAQEIPQGRRVGLYHFGLKVADSDEELKAVFDHIRAEGVKVLGTAEIELYSDVADVDWRNDPDLILAPTRSLPL